MIRVLCTLAYLTIVSYAVLHVYAFSKVSGYQTVIYIVPKAEVSVNDYNLITSEKFSAVYIESGADAGFCVSSDSVSYCEYIMGVGDYFYINTETQFYDASFFLSTFVLRPMFYYLFNRVYVGVSELRSEA